jgi:hypothetical protein
MATEQTENRNNTPEGKVSAPVSHGRLFVSAFGEGNFLNESKNQQ